MKDFKLGIQLYTVRDFMEKDFFGTLEKVKKMGYEGVEFAGLYGYSPAQVKKMCEEVGLVPISAHIPFVEMLENPEILRDYKEIGCEFVVMPYLEEEYRPGEEKFATVISGVDMLAKKAKELGLKMCYHNHDFEFTKIGGKYAIDIIYDTISAELLQPQFDTCWVKVAGENPADYIRKYAGRQEILHLKDYVGEQTENMYELIGLDEGSIKEESDSFELRPVGSGCQNFPEILTAAKQAKIRWVIVEQDRPSLGLDAMQCAQKSCEYLNNL